MTAPVLDLLAHYEAVKGLLVAVPPVATLYEGQVPGQPAFPYWVLYMDTGDEAVGRLCGASNQADFRFQVTSVGLTDAAVRVLAAAARARLLDVRLTVSGRTCTPIRKETTLPVRPDRDVTLPDSNLNPMYGVDTFHFVSYAA